MRGGYGAAVRVFQDGNVSSHPEIVCRLDWLHVYSYRALRDIRATLCPALPELPDVENLDAGGLLADLTGLALLAAPPPAESDARDWGDYR